MIRLLFLLAVSLAAAAQSLANIPACGGPQKVKAEADGSYLLMRVQDPAGSTIDIWCAKESGGFNYQYRLQNVLLDRCQLPNGLSTAGVEHEGPVAESLLPNGGQWLRTAGKLSKFRHNNWDSYRGHHAVYDIQRQLMTTYATVAVQDQAGRWARAFVDVNSSHLRTLTQAPREQERSFDPNRVACITASSNEGNGIHEQEVGAFIAPQQAGRLTVAWPDSAPIDKIEFDAARRELHLKFLPNTRKAIVSIAIPRTMLGLGRELSHVRLDGRFVESDENTTATHKSIRFTINEPVGEALLTESQGFPFFAVTGIALLGAVIIGGVIGMLFRRKLPAVPEE